MMAKIKKGRDFGGAVRYVTQDKKGARLLDSKGVLTADKQSIIDSFRLQSQLRPDVKVMVGHISLDFSKEDVDKVDDNLMRKVAPSTSLCATSTVSILTVTLFSTESTTTVILSPTRTTISEAARYARNSPVSTVCTWHKAKTMFTVSDCVEPMP